VIGGVSPARRLAWAARAERLRAEAHAERAPENDDDGVVRFQITAYYTFSGRYAEEPEEVECVCAEPTIARFCKAHGDAP